MNIKSFMMEVIGDTKEIKIERFPEPFVIEAISETENDRLKKVHTTKRRSKSGNTIKNLDTDKYGDALLARCVKTPDLQDADLQAYYKTEGSATDTLKAMLLAGEYANLTKEVLELNGFNEDEDDLKEDVKK
ncbi:phage tail assembly chaperone [Enterococcus gallinarum]|uniref:Phage portal protein n=1 Tax=Enterococcus gallinarum TaxID=1353 RepID=A0ABD4ZX35_ENTGA|nr:phage portal protein [Enterococcus gallinarum]MBF0824587.1 phage portal protein [Enterococcus faecalis]MBA0948678.1 phage portal protein [Enterococcus gallinarum]MBA0961710.1 phage portal protein [Enterococcus gallinarum]MBA0969648.1 phage portal protein [Enterococcus gallinarum]MBA0973010.1 phage portal protein [Enterococcus gallinarum]